MSSVWEMCYTHVPLASSTNEINGLVLMAFSQLVSDDRAGVRHDLTSLSSCRPLVSSFRLSITWASFCSSTSLFFSSSSFRSDASVMILSLLAGTLLTSSSCTEHKRSVERLQSCSASGDQDASPSPCLSEAVSAVSWLCSWCVWASRAPPRPAGPAGWTSPSGSLWTWSAWSVSFWGKTSTTPFNYETAINTRLSEQQMGHLGLGDVYKIGIGRCLQWNIAMGDDIWGGVWGRSQGVCPKRESIFRKTRETHNDCLLHYIT